jgi:hypothetical protein
MAIQAGIPVYKMICTEDGHTSVSIAPALASCEHEQEDDCCKPIHSSSQKKSCCDFNQSTIKLDVCPTIYEPQLTTGHCIPSVEWFFAPPQILLSGITCSTHNSSFPERKQCRQSVIQVFRI